MYKITLQGQVPVVSNGLPLYYYYYYYYMDTIK